MQTITEIPKDVLWAMYNLKEISNKNWLDVIINFEECKNTQKPTLSTTE